MLDSLVDCMFYEIAVSLTIRYSMFEKNPTHQILLTCNTIRVTLALVNDKKASNDCGALQPREK